ncbi:MAG: hypothetical protein IKA04_06155 [Alistipes sp.]|nr:hypothetical protein [Alistipes sp.]
MKNPKTIENYLRRKMRLEALLAVVQHKVELVKIIRTAPNLKKAEENIVSHFGLTSEQAQYLLNADVCFLLDSEHEDVQKKYNQVVACLTKHNNDTSIMSRENVITEFFEDNKFLSNTQWEYTLWRGQKSSWSKSFTDIKSDNCSSLKEIFGIINENFEEKFKQAVSGLEKKRIMTLHSSSLLALMLFHSVSEENPIHFCINGKIVAFTDVRFEVKNSVDESGSKTKSNVDIVLSGSGYTLYLESKFSEYLGSGTENISSTLYYKEIFKRLRRCLEQAGLKIEFKDKIYIKGRGKYCKGPKQMISHYLGIKTSEKTDQSHVVLGEILFDFGKLSKNKLDSYKDIYKSLRAGLENCAKDDGINLIINDLITYQQVFQLKENQTFLERLPKNIRTFYKL